MGTTQRKEFELFDYPVVPAPPLPSWETLVCAPVPGTNCGEDSHEARSGPEKQSWVGPAGIGASATSASAASASAASAGESHARALEQSFEKGRRAGVDEGRAAERQIAAALARAGEAEHAGQTARLIETFNAEVIGYFQTVEREVVKLALAVAARILRRESQMDPLLLSSAVRAVLGQLSSATSVRLRVPAGDLDLWRETIAHLPNLSIKPAVVGDDRMSLGECALESELGSVDLGIDAQLEEIERGFFDGASSARSAPDVIAVREDMSE